MKLYLATLVLAGLLASAHCELDQGTVRLNRLAERSLLTSNRVITFSNSDFQCPLTYLGST